MRWAGKAPCADVSGAFVEEQLCLRGDDVIHHGPYRSFEGPQGLGGQLARALRNPFKSCLLCDRLRRFEDQSAARGKEPRQVAQGSQRIRQMFENLEQRDGVERPLPSRLTSAPPKS